MDIIYVLKIHYLESLVLNLFIKEPDGNYSSIKVNSNMQIDIKEGQQLYFDNYYEKYTVSLTDGDKSIKMIFEVGGERVSLVLSNMAELIKQSDKQTENKTVLTIIADVEGILDLQETVFNTNFSGGDVIKELKERLAESEGESSHGIVIDDFGSLFSYLEASASAGEVLSTAVVSSVVEEEIIEEGGLEDTTRPDSDEGSTSSYTSPITRTSSSGLFKNLCQSGKIKNTKGHRDEDRNRC